MIEWPEHTSDFMRLDLWGFLKIVVYKAKPHVLNNLTGLTIANR